MTPHRPIFVYGILRPGEAGFLELALANRVELLGPATIPGTLYDLGDYPGAVLSDALNGEGMIVGDLLRPLDDDLLPILDAFELYDPADSEGSEYIRVSAKADDGTTGWIYVYNHPLDGFPVIASGDWLNRPGRPPTRSSQG